MDDPPVILIVDDDDAIRDFVSTIIENMGYRADSVSNGAMALEYLANNPHPDLILLDVIMPGMTGIDLLREIKTTPDIAEIGVIMVTGVHHIIEKELAFKLGACDYVEKPFDTRELLARIKTHVNLKKATERCIIQKKVQDTILSTVLGIVYLKSRDGTYIHGNEKFADLVGISSEDIEGKTDYDLFEHSIAAQRIQTDELIVKMGIPEFEMQEELKTKSGETRIFLTRKRPVYDAKNELTALVGVSIDITDQIIIRDAYCEKEELLSAILNANIYEIWVINADGDLILQNAVHLNKFGNLIGENINTLPLPTQIRSRWSEGLISAQKGEVSFQENLISDSDASYSEVECMGPVGQDDQFLGVMGIRVSIPAHTWTPSEIVTITRYIRAEFMGFGGDGDPDRSGSGLFQKEAQDGSHSYR